MTSRNPFDIVKEIITEERTSVSNPFMVNRILSFQPLTALTAIEVNKYVGYIPDWAISDLFNLTVPHRRRVPYLKYPKRGKVKDKKLIDKIRQALCVNELHARQVIELLRNKGEQPERLFGLKEGE